MKIFLLNDFKEKLQKDYNHLRISKFRLGVGTFFDKELNIYCLPHISEDEDNKKDLIFKSDEGRAPTHGYYPLLFIREDSETYQISFYIDEYNHTLQEINKNVYNLIYVYYRDLNEKEAKNYLGFVFHNGIVDSGEDYLLNYLTPIKITDETNIISFKFPVEVNCNLDLGYIDYQRKLDEDGILNITNVYNTERYDSNQNLITKEILSKHSYNKYRETLCLNDDDDYKSEYKKEVNDLLGETVIENENNIYPSGRGVFLNKFGLKIY